jgi:hypothetical protein
LNVRELLEMQVFSNHQDQLLYHALLVQVYISAGADILAVARRLRVRERRGDGGNRQWYVVKRTTIQLGQ